MKNKAEDGSIYAAAAALLLLPAALVLFSSAKLHYPTAQWDDSALNAVLAIRAGTFADKPYIIHPPLYLYLLAFFQPLFRGGLLEGARFFNFACYLVTGWLVFLLSGKLAASKARRTAGIIGAILYFTSPLATQGMFLLDLGDTGIVPVASAGYFCLLFYGNGFFRFAALSAAFALNLWAKLIHSLFLALSALATTIIKNEGGRDRADIFALATGIILFILTWTIYAHNSLHPADQWGPLQYFLNEVLLNYQRNDLAAGPREIFIARALAVARVMLWLWPLLLLWVWRLYRRGFDTGPGRLMNYFILIFILGAWASKGTSNGFPKYHAALLPPLCALCASYVAKFIPEWRRAACIPAVSFGAVVLTAAYLSGDPLYTFNYTFKEALINGSGMHAALLCFGLQVLAIPALLLAVWAAYRKSFERVSAVALSLAVVGLLCQVALYARQARGDYFTTYGYGTTGKQAAVDYVKRNFKKGATFGPNEFAWEFKAAGVPFLDVSDKCFIERKCALSVMRDRDTSFFVFGQASNTVEQVKYFLSLDPQTLGRPFAVVKKGDFWIYDFNQGRESSIL